MASRWREATRVLRWFDPRGRLSRRTYGRLFVRLTLLSAAMLCLAIPLAAHGWRGAAFAAVSGIALVWLASLVQAVRRLHDRSRTGWWICLSLGLSALDFVPVEAEAAAYPVAVVAYTLITVAAALWFLVETLGRRGTRGPNRYGPEPQGASRSTG